MDQKVTQVYSSNASYYKKNISNNETKNLRYNFTIFDTLQEVEEIDKKIDKTEAELRKCSTGIANVFLQDMEKERERRKMALHTKMIDPRSAARTAAANRMPHYKLRYHIYTYILGLYENTLS